MEVPTSGWLILCCGVGSVAKLISLPAHLRTKPAACFDESRLVGFFGCSLDFRNLRLTRNSNCSSMLFCHVVAQQRSVSRVHAELVVEPTQGLVKLGESVGISGFMLFLSCCFRSINVGVCRCPKMWVAPNHTFCRIWHEINHPASSSYWVDPISGTTPARHLGRSAPLERVHCRSQFHGAHLRQ